MCRLKKCTKEGATYHWLMAWVVSFSSQASIGTEFFVTDMTRGRLTFQQKNFSGNRFSDHVAAVNAFNRWEDIRQSGAEAELRFCEHKGLNLSTMRTTWEAKNQLRERLVSEGFPEECLVPQVCAHVVIFWNTRLCCTEKSIE